MENNIPKTYKEALEQGYREIDNRWNRRYISRKINIDEAPVRVAGGNRKGQLYVELPDWESDKFSRRQYLAK